MTRDLIKSMKSIQIFQDSGKLCFVLSTARAMNTTKLEQDQKKQLEDQEQHASKGSPKVHGGIFPKQPSNAKETSTRLWVNSGALPLYPG